MHADLYFQEGSSDKVYKINLDQHESYYKVRAQWGRRGNTLQEATKYLGESQRDAERTFNKLLNSKLSKGYSQVQYNERDIVIGEGFAAYDPGRTLAAGAHAINGRGFGAGSGKRDGTGSGHDPDEPLTPETFDSLLQYPSSMLDNSKPRSKGPTRRTPKGHTPLNVRRRLNLEPEECDKIFVPHLLKPANGKTTEMNRRVLNDFMRDNSYCAQEKKDGQHFTIKRVRDDVIVRNKLGKSVGFPPEIIKMLGEIEGDIHLDVEGIGKTYHIFDIMLLGDRDLTGYGYEDRYSKLVEIKSKLSLPVNGYSFKLVPLIKGTTAKTALHNRLTRKNKEGIVFKKLRAPYVSGARNDTMCKFKFYAELSARVCEGRVGKSSIGLELLNGDKWVKVGNCTVSAKKMYSIRPGMVVEIKYLYGYKGGSLYQPSFKEIRDDVLSSECSMDQIKYKSEEDD